MKRKIVGVGISIVTIAIFLEMLSAGWFFLSHGELFYGANDRTISAQSPEPEARPDAPIGVRHRLHPYFGFTKWTDPSLRVNNHGFPGNAHDFPFVKAKPEQYIIGVFGGSVATGFSNMGQAHLVERLKQHPAFRDKEIVLLNFAQGGYKQPQQLLVLNYYLASGQELDMVINVDGFNEVALSARNDGKGVEVAMPSVDHVLPLVALIDRSALSTEQIRSLDNINRYRSQMAALTERLSRARMASTWFVLQQLYRIVSGSYSREVVAFQDLTSGVSEDSLMYLSPSMAPGNETALYGRIADVWASSSILMKEVLQEEGIPYFHILQPNQYYSAKVFTAEERRTALSDQHPYGIAAARGYPYLLDQAARLTDSGEKFFSAVDLFDRETATIYIDDCCHFNERGNEILADFVADAILSTFP